MDKTIENYLSRKELVARILDVKEILQFSKGDKAKIIMGVTFDAGQTLDMMKYGLFLMDLHDLLTKKGVNAEAQWIIADHFMTDLNKDLAQEQAKSQGLERINFLQNLNTIYHGNICLLRTSKLSKGGDYQRNTKRLKEEIKLNPEFKEKVLLAIPEDRRENPEAINYPLEELATIQTLKTNIKVGPKSEIFYDFVAREFFEQIGFEKYIAIHLTNCLPFGNPEIPEGERAWVNKFGVLPYKKNSKGLGDYRIDPLNDDPKEVIELIRTTTDKRALVNLIVTADLAGHRLRKEISQTDFSTLPKLDQQALREQAVEGYHQFLTKTSRMPYRLE